MAEIHFSYLLQKANKILVLLGGTYALLHWPPQTVAYGTNDSKSKQYLILKFPRR